MIYAQYSCSVKDSIHYKSYFFLYFHRSKLYRWNSWYRTLFGSILKVSSIHIYDLYLIIWYNKHLQSYAIIMKKSRVDTICFTFYESSWIDIHVEFHAELQWKVYGMPFRCNKHLQPYVIILKNIRIDAKTLRKFYEHSWFVIIFR